MPKLIAGPGITEFFRDGFQHTAWRLETRRVYGVPAESERFREFLAGTGDRGRDPDSEWVRVIRAITGQGKRVERVRLVDNPPTDYQRFLLNNVVDNLAAGEDIRYLTRDRAAETGLPEQDFWLFDARVIGVFHFDGDRSLGMEMSEHPQTVLTGCQTRDAAWHFAIPYDDFTVEVASGV